MRAYLIDPYELTCEEIDFNGGYEEVLRLIDSDSLDTARLGYDVAYVSDTGLLDGLPVFLLDFYPHPLAGKALVLGVDEYGESCAPEMTLEELQSSLYWVFSESD